MATRIGVDVGGTFTDLIYYDDETGEIRVDKEPTTPASPELGVIAAVEKTLGGGELDRAGYFLHGTTVGLNSLLTRTGAAVGLLCTKGFRDILETRRGDRDEPYNLFWRPPAPLVPRRLRLAVTERIRAGGEVHVPIEADDVRRAAEVFAAEGVTAVAIAFMNAYSNPEHELAAESALRDAGFTGDISVSHQVSGEYREYERTSTTVIDAYVRGRMASYLRRLEDGLGDAGFSGSLLVTRSGGGAMTFGEAERRPFETIMSGPVAGAEGGAELARILDLSDVVTADVGGTSFDTCLILDGRLPVLYEGSIVGMPLQTPWVDVRSIGAGGGSLAYVDVGGLLRVGPQSAGAEPGPASYGRGGTQPTVTDAAAVLGMLAEGSLAGGVTLDIDAARRALAPLGEQLGMEVEDVAKGVLRSPPRTWRTRFARSRSSKVRTRAAARSCRSEARGRCSARCSPPSSTSAGSWCLRWPATSPPGACWAPTSSARPVGRGSCALTTPRSRRQTRCWVTCSPCSPSAGVRVRKARGKSGSTCATSDRSTSSPS